MTDRPTKAQTHLDALEDDGKELGLDEISERALILVFGGRKLGEERLPLLPGDAYL